MSEAEAAVVGDAPRRGANRVVLSDAVVPSAGGGSAGGGGGAAATPAADGRVVPQLGGGVLHYCVFSSWMELSLTLTLTHRKYTDDCPLVTSLRRNA